MCNNDDNNNPSAFELNDGEDHFVFHHVGTFMNKPTININVGEPAATKTKNEDEDFDIDRFPARHFNWVRGVNDKARKEEIMTMRQEVVEEAERYEDMSRHKSEILSAVFVPRIQKDKIKSIPSHSILLDLFGDCIDGIAKKAHNDWKRELEWKYWHRKAKRRG